MLIAILFTPYYTEINILCHIEMYVHVCMYVCSYKSQGKYT